MLHVQAVHFERLPPRQPKCGMPQFPLSQPSLAALADRYITQLFSHQALAVDTLISGTPHLCTHEHPTCHLLMLAMQWTWAAVATSNFIARKL